MGFTKAKLKRGLNLMKKDITIKEIQRFENYYDKIKNEELSINLKELTKYLTKKLSII